MGIHRNSKGPGRRLDGSLSELPPRTARGHNTRSGVPGCCSGHDATVYTRRVARGKYVVGLRCVVDVEPGMTQPFD